MSALYHVQRRARTARRKGCCRLGQPGLRAMTTSVSPGQSQKMPASSGEPAGSGAATMVLPDGDFAELLRWLRAALLPAAPDGSAWRVLTC